jgi:ABC-2 type transport system ATP-binding protein
VAGEVDDLLACHRVLSGPDADADRYAEHLNVVHALHSKAQTHLLIRTDGRTEPVPPGWKARSISLEELALAYLREPGAASLPGPRRARHAEPTELAR